MKKQVKLTAKETSATNHDFYNLFRPITPSLDIIGKVAQVISAITEAITIWHITQSEMVGSSKIVAIIVSLFAILLVVAVLELGGRKFLQVVTRALVWKRLKNSWYIALFVIVSLITVGMGVLSFRLSTNGIKHAFVSNVPVTTIIDDSEMKSDYRRGVREIDSQFDKEWRMIKENHREITMSTSDKFKAEIAVIDLKIEEYESKYRNGSKWAKGHIENYRKKATHLATEKANAIAKLNAKKTEKLENWQNRKNKAIAAEKSEMKSAIATVITQQNKVLDSKRTNANFWGGLFSWLVGFSVILAFICIVTVEVYRRGSGIQVKYEEEDKTPSILEMLWDGVVLRLDSFIRVRAERFAKITKPESVQKTIGFSYPSQTTSPSFGMEMSNEETETF
jgi:hypothetical protein